MIGDPPRPLLLYRSLFDWQPQRYAWPIRDLMKKRRIWDNAVDEDDERRQIAALGR